MIESFEEQIAKKTDSELTDIYIEYFKYQKEFVDLVEEELRKRSLPIDSIIELRKRNEKIIDETLTQGEQGSPVWITIGFFLSLLGGILAIFLGYSYAYSKKKNSNGESFYVYNESTRKYGRIMFILGLFMLVLGLFFNIFD
jgi:hypothetical protein